jgi:hypothetical protein
MNTKISVMLRFDESAGKREESSMGNNPIFGDVAQQAARTVQHALGDLHTLVTAAEQAQNAMKEAMVRAQRAAALVHPLRSSLCGQDYTS